MIEYGIDLGTTNSAIARQRSGRVTLLPGSDGRVLMPSAVNVATDGQIVVGEPARRAARADPANTAIEFKRLMGTSDAIAFPASGSKLTAEQLSAEVLKALVQRTRVLGDPEPPRAVVITIPAMFQLPQCEATRRAASLAGIEHAPLLQEPIAAAIAHSGSGELREGKWLVYDLGGGTFDISLVRSRGGRLQVLDHDGDNHLGGRDFDRVIVRKAAEVIRREGRLGDFRRSEPSLTQAFTRLKAEAELVRVALSTQTEVEFKVEHLGVDADGASVGIRFALERGEFDLLVEPLVGRTTALCNQILARNRISARELTGLVLVGGPTHTPCVLRMLHWDVGLEARHVVDPMQVVAHGAALFASTQKVPSALASRGRNSAGASLDLEYESMTTNPAPLLVGAISPESKVKGAWVRVTREDGGFDSGLVDLASGSFALEVSLRPGNLSVFKIELYSGDRRPIPCEPREISILHGLSVANPPLSQSVGVMLADNTVAWYLRRGTVLPGRRTVKHATTQALQRGGSGVAINVPLVQGESERAERNKVIGVLRIHAERIGRDLPVGAEVEVTLIVDEFARTTGKAYVPMLDQWFEDVLLFGMEAKDAAQMKGDLEKQKERLAALESLAGELEASGLGEGDPRLREIETLLEEGEGEGHGRGDAVDVAERILLKLSDEIDRAEEKGRGRTLEKDANDAIERSRAIFGAHQAHEELRQLAALEAEFTAAMTGGELDLAKDRLEALESLDQQAVMRVPQFWAALLDDLGKRLEHAGKAAVAAPTLAKGNRGAAAHDIPAMAQACRELFKFLPSTDQEEVSVPRITSQVN